MSKGKLVTTFSAVVLALSFGGHALAAGQTGAMTGTGAAAGTGGAMTGAAGQGTAADQIANSFRASNIEGLQVTGPQGNEVGKISEVIISPTGTVSHVVLSKGGLLGVGGNKYLVPWNRIQLQPTASTATIDVSADQLSAEFAAFEESMIQTGPGAGGAGAGGTVPGKTGTGTTGGGTPGGTAPGATE